MIVPRRQCCCTSDNAPYRVSPRARLFLRMMLLVCLTACLPSVEGACICDTNTTLQAALNDLRNSIRATTSWGALASKCDWPGVDCSTNAGLVSLTICGASTTCTLGGSLPTSASTWASLGMNLSTLAVSNVGSRLTGGFPAIASTSLTSLQTLLFSSFSPSGSIVIPTGAPVASGGLSVTLLSSTVTIAGSSTSRVTSLFVTSAQIPDVSGISALSSIDIAYGALGTISWTSMVSLRSIRIVNSAGVTGALPSAWTGANYPNLTSITLSNVGITSFGVAPSPWGSIASLTAINLALCRGLAAAPPDSWSALVNLQFLSITDAPLSGSLPASWSSMTSLVAMTIIGASFATGAATIPTTWASSFRNLTNLTIVNSGLSGSIPAFTVARSMVSLTLSGNALTGPLPNPITAGNLTSFDISNNPINSTLPLWSTHASLVILRCDSCSLFGSLPAWGPAGTPPLQIISLNNNTFGASIPSAWSTLSSLTNMTIRGSNVVGGLPQRWLSRRLLGFDVSSNNITGSIGSLVFDSPVISQLNISSNRLGPSCSFDVGNSVRVLLLNDNACVGPHPNWTTGGTNLTIVDLSRNSFSGLMMDIPSSVLQVLRIDRGNRFIGNLPDVLSRSPLLVECSANGNNFNGTFAGVSASSNSLQIMRLANNSLSGALPTTFFASSAGSATLLYLDISANNFQGSFPMVLAFATSLIELNISRNNFVGSLQLGGSSTATSLRVLDVSRNALNGTLPSWGSSSSLRYVDVSLNALTGSVPSLSSTSVLVVLNVSGNQLSGSLQLSSSLSALECIDVSCNTLSGALPLWGTSSVLAYVNVTCGNTFSGSVPVFSTDVSRSLVTFDVTDQRLAGTLSAALGSQFSNTSNLQNVALRTLLVGGNKFVGAAPPFLGWPKLERVNISNNSLVGTIANATVFPVALWSIDLSNNSGLSGTIPVPTATSFTALQHLLLGGDAHTFSGALPPLHTKFPSLTRFSLSGSFNVALPYDWLVGGAAWVNLTTLSLRKCGFSGTFPSPLASTRLTLLDFSTNSLEGTLPDVLSSSLQSLRQIMLYGNTFAGTLPSSWSSLAQLALLDVHSCNLSGSVPLTYVSPQLSVLDLSDNRFTGNVHTIAFPFPNNSLIVVNLSVNQLGPNCAFVVPTNVSALSLASNLCTGAQPNWTLATAGLVTVDLRGNMFTGALLTIPSIAKLQVLRIDGGNRFTGSLPNWGAAASIVEVSASHNLLNGSIPSFHAAANVQVFRVANNSLSGALPTTWGTLGGALQYFDVSSNQLQGSLPSFSSATLLMLLNVSRNRLTGSLQLASSLSALQLIDVSLNSLAGSVPPSWGSSTGLLFFDISSNSFSGTLPSLSNSYLITMLNISRNALSGSIQLSSSLPSLNTLDVACNSLTGSLPSWGGSTLLQHVNVSCGNVFSGALPAVSSQAYASIAVFDLSNQNLTGTLTSALGAAFSSSTTWSSVAMRSLLVGGNAFAGTLPPFLRWPLLEKLNVSSNKLTGSVFSGSAFPVALWSIDLSNNSGLSGTVPVPTAASFTALQHLLLGGDAHSFSGALPPLHTKFPSLTRFSLSGSFNVALPYDWLVGSAAWVNLTTLSLRKCGFSGTFPSPLASTQLTLLDLSSNRLGGSLPADLPTYMPQLATLDLSVNLFVGELPARLQYSVNLIRLSLHSCSLSGTLPADLPTSLQVLLLYNNNISSSTSDAPLWASLPNLVRLDVSSNNLTDIPLFPSTSPLSSLNVSGNQYAATLPASWANLGRLATLNASSSGLYGSIPTEWASGPLGAVLRDLDLSGNSLGGVLTQVPRILNGSYFPMLQTLQLRSVNATGPLPGNAAISPTLTDVDLSGNSLTGQLTAALVASASSLRTLQLQGNALSGTLPKPLGVSGVVPASLQLLNLSSNAFSGPLPYNWGALFRRATLSIDLCANDLCGSVPRSLNGISNIGLARCGASLRPDADCYTASASLDLSDTLCSLCRTPSSARSNSSSPSDGLSMSRTRERSTGTLTLPRCDRLHRPQRHNTGYRIARGQRHYVASIVLVAVTLPPSIHHPNTSVGRSHKERNTFAARHAQPIWSSAVAVVKL